MAAGYIPIDTTRTEAKAPVTSSLMTEGFVNNPNAIVQSGAIPEMNPLITYNRGAIVHIKSDQYITGWSFSILIVFVAVSVSSSGASPTDRAQWFPLGRYSLSYGTAEFDYDLQVHAKRGSVQLYPCPAIVKSNGSWTFGGDVLGMLVLDGRQYDNYSIRFTDPQKTFIEDGFGTSGKFDFSGLITINTITNTLETNDLSSYFPYPNGSNSTFGVVEEDQMQGHWHESLPSVGRTTGGSTAGTTSGLIQDGFGANFVRNPITDSVNGTPRTGEKTLPPRINAGYAVLYIGY